MCVSIKPDVVFLPGFAFKSSISPLFFSSIENLSIQPVDLADLASLSLQQPAIWVGWSLGGLMALAFCQRHPALCRKLIMICSSPKFAAEEHWPGISKVSLQQIKHNFRHHPEAALKQFLGAVLKPFITPHGYQTLLTYRESNADLIKDCLSFLINSDLRVAYQNLQCAAKVFLSEQDNILPIELMANLQRLNPNIPIISLANMSHAPFISHPQVFAEVLSQCLTS